MDAEESALQKQEWLEHALAEWRDALEPLRAPRADRRLGYREKTCLRAEWKDGAWHFGMQVRQRGERKPTLVEIPECPVHSARVRGILHFFSTRLPPFKEFPLVYISISGALVTLVVKARELEPDLVAGGILSKLGKSVAGVEGLYVNLNPSAGNRVFSSRGWLHIWGAEYAQAGELVHGPSSFQQLIPELYEESLNEAVEYLNPNAKAFVVDLYSGVGATLKRWVARDATTLGAELSGEAVNCSEKNTSRTGISLRGKVEDRIPQLDAALPVGKRRLLYTNPPRTGMDEVTLQWISKNLMPEKIAYLSCNAGSLRRDLQSLSKTYAVDRLVPFDFFPQTEHVETLALLRRLPLQ